MKFKFIPEVGFTAGDIANLYLGSFGTKGTETQVIIKKSRMPADKDLMMAEVQTLMNLHKQMPKPTNPYTFFIPKVFDAFPVDEQYVTVMEAFHGFFDCEGIRQLSTGVDARTLVWMWKRLVGLLTWVHHFGYVHGAILPPHVMYFPDGTVNDERKHAVRLVDWCYAVKTHSRVSAWVPDFKDFYAPEIIKKQPVGPWTDLYMGAKTMLYLCGGDVKKNRWPSRIPGQIVVSLNTCLRQDPSLRPQKASDYFTDLKTTVTQTYGAPRFHEFKLPGV